MPPAMPAAPAVPIARFLPRWLFFSGLASTGAASCLVTGISQSVTELRAEPGVLGWELSEAVWISSDPVERRDEPGVPDSLLSYPPSHLVIRLETEVLGAELDAELAVEPKELVPERNLLEVGDEGRLSSAAEVPALSALACFLISASSLAWFFTWFSFALVSLESASLRGACPPTLFLPIRAIEFSFVVPEFRGWFA